jgi:hypothetical protein
MLRRFYGTHGGIYGIPYDHGSCLSTILKTIQDGICLVGRNSCAGALLLPFPFNSNAIVAHIPFWYVEKGRQIAIFDVLLRECKRAGAKFVNVAALAPKGTGKRFYAVRGLKLAEFQYIGPVEKT